MKRPTRHRTVRGLTKAEGSGRVSRTTEASRTRIPKSQFPVPDSYRLGIGNDLHRLAAGRRLMLGGVMIPFESGSVGHSDGDVLIHAICDALLGAAALGDIGRHFPDTAPEWGNASSLVFLRQVGKLLDKRGYRIVNIDSTVGLEKPRLAPHIPRIVKKLAAALRLQLGQISVKAKTGEGLDAIGRGEAIRADAGALIRLTRLPDSELQPKG